MIPVLDLTCQPFIDLLDSVREYEVFDQVPAVILCTLGLEPGLPRSSRSLASVATTYPALRLTRQLAGDLSQHF